MRSNIGIWWLLAAFFLFCAILYTVWNEIAGHHVEWVGTVALLFSAFMSMLIAFFAQRLHKSYHGVELPEDRLDADIDDADPEHGEFSPWSWWPLVLGGAVAIFVVGLATAHFIIPLGLGLLVVALFGWVYEYYRGNFAR